jgi:hypothetical protein
VRLEGLGKLKKSNDLIGNRSRDIPACSIVPQPSTLPRDPIISHVDPKLSLLYIKLSVDFSMYSINSSTFLYFIIVNFCNLSYNFKCIVIFHTNILVNIKFLFQTVGL